MGQRDARSDDRGGCRDRGLAVPRDRFPGRARVALTLEWDELRESRLLDAALPEMSEIDVARTDGFRDDLANRSSAIREAAGRGKPLIESASAWLGITRWHRAGRAVRLRVR